MNRFTVYESYNRGSWLIRDNDAHLYNTNGANAVAIFFSTEVAANEVALLLNKEWKKFLQNPT